MKRKLVFKIILFMLTLGVFITTITAYFFDQQVTDELIFEVGDVSFIWQGSYKDLEFIVPGQELIETPLSLTNASNIKTELRLSIIITSSLLGEVLIDEMFIYELFEGWVELPDGFFYYQDPLTTTFEDGKYMIDINQDVFVLSSLMLDGFLVRNEHSHEMVTITLRFQAKQAHYVDWLDLGETVFTLD